MVFAPLTYAGQYPPLRPRSDADVKSFELLHASLRALPELSKEGDRILNEEMLARLVDGVRRFQRDHLGRGAKYRPAVRLPDPIFSDRSSHPNGPLGTALLSAFRYKRDAPWRNFNFDNPKLFDDNVAIVRKVEKDLSDRGFLKRPAIYFDATVEEGLGKVEAARLAKVAMRHGATATADPRDVARGRVTHVVAYDPEEHDAPEAIEEEVRRERSGEEPERTYLKTLALVDAEVDEGRGGGGGSGAKDEGEGGGGGAGAEDDGADVGGKRTKRMALVHWWYHPHSYDEWMDASDVAGEVETEFHPGIPGGPAVVGCKFVRDVEVFNEWGSEADYAVMEFERKIAYLRGETNKPAASTSSKKSSKRRASVVKSTLEQLEGGPAAKRRRADGDDGMASAPSQAPFPDRSKPPPKPAPRRPAARQPTERRRPVAAAGMDPRRIAAGVRGPRGETLRRTVHDGALRVGDVPYRVLRDALADYLAGSGAGLPTLAARPEWRRSLPMTGFVRPSADPSRKTMDVIELTLTKEKASSGNDEATEPVAPKTEAVHQSVPVLIPPGFGGEGEGGEEPLSMRGGGLEGEGEAEVASDAPDPEASGVATSDAAADPSYEGGIDGGGEDGERVLEEDGGEAEGGSPEGEGEAEVASAASEPEALGIATSDAPADHSYDGGGEGEVEVEVAEDPPHPGAGESDARPVGANVDSEAIASDDVLATAEPTDNIPARSGGDTSAPAATGSADPADNIPVSTEGDTTAPAEVVTQAEPTKPSERVATVLVPAGAADEDKEDIATTAEPMEVELSDVPEASTLKAEVSIPAATADTADSVAVDGAEVVTAAPADSVTDDPAASEKAAIAKEVARVLASEGTTEIAETATTAAPGTGTTTTPATGTLAATAVIKADAKPTTATDTTTTSAPATASSTSPIDSKTENEVATSATVTTTNQVTTSEFQPATEIQPKAETGTAISSSKDEPTLSKVLSLPTGTQLTSSLYRPPPAAAAASGEDSKKSDTSRPSWYDRASASEFERRTLPEWFNSSAPHRTPMAYLATREKMLDLAERNAHQFITSTAIRRSVAGDAGSILRLHKFLMDYGLLNGDRIGDTAPSDATLRGLRADTKAGNRSHAETAAWSQSRLRLLEELVVRNIKTDTADESNMSIDWDAIAAEIGNGVSPRDCQQAFLEPPVEDASDALVEGDGGAAMLSRLLGGVRQEVLGAAIEASLRATRDISEARKASLVAAVAGAAAERGASAEAEAELTMINIVDQRLRRLENRAALLDDVEALLEAERVALELERRDLYTSRCRHWFGDGSS